MLSILVPVVTTVLGFVFGLAVGRRTSHMNQVLLAYEALDILRGAPDRVQWRPTTRASGSQVKITEEPWLPSDTDWKTSMSRLSALASVLNDDLLYESIAQVEAHLDGYVRAARSTGLDSATRDTNRVTHLKELAENLAKAEERLGEWRCLGRWAMLSLGIGRKAISRRRAVSG